MGFFFFPPPPSARQAVFSITKWQFVCSLPPLLGTVILRLDPLGPLKGNGANVGLYISGAGSGVFFCALGKGPGVRESLAVSAFARGAGPRGLRRGSGDMGPSVAGYPLQPPPWRPPLPLVQTPPKGGGVP